MIADLKFNETRASARSLSRRVTGGHQHLEPSVVSRCPARQKSLTSRTDSPQRNELAFWAVSICSNE
jgi:hypothetical protein